MRVGSRVGSVVLPLAFAAALWWATGGPSAASASTPAGTGAELYVAACATCHGPDGAGTPRAPSLFSEGPAAVDFVLSTGRMPPGDIDVQAHRRQPRFSDTEIAALVEFVGALGSGPAIPSVDLTAADIAAGGELYRLNCASCHQAGGAGAALSGGRFAPALDAAEPVQIVEAMLVGPGAMPVFSALDDTQRSDIAAYVVQLRTESDQGGFALGRVGPVAEGLLAWCALAVLVVITTVIGIRRQQ